jgi:hypothetical protein
MIAKTPTGRRVEWPTVAVLALTLALLAVIWIVGPDHRGDYLLTIGAIGGFVLAFMRGIASPAALVLVAFLGSGCGASALRTHATIATVASIAIGGAAPLVAPTCDAALNACHGEAQCVSETAERCRVAGASVDGLALATRAYIDAIEVASMAEEGETLPALMTGLSRLVVRWGEVVALLGRFGIDLQALPALASSLLSGGAL